MDAPENNSRDNFADRLRLWRVSRDLTQAEAARLLDIDRSYYSQVERFRPPGNSLRARFQLLEKSSLKDNGHAVAHRELRNLPVLSWSQAIEAIDVDQVAREGNEVVPGDAQDERAFGIRLRGDSMEPKFSDGDIAILLPGTAPTNGDIVVANIREQGVLCKIMHIQLDKNLIKLSSYNPAYPPTEYHRGEVYWIFPVTTVIKELRRR